MLKKIYHFFHKYYHKNYHGIYRHAKKLFVFDLGLMALAVVMLAAGLFFFFWKPGITDLIDLNISLGNGRIQSGDTARVVVEYANKSKYKLTNISFSLRLPDGFIVDRSKTQENIFSDNSIFSQIKELPAGAKGQVEIYGRFWAVPNKEERLVADLSYEPESLNRREQKAAALISTLPGSVLQGKLDISSSSFPNSSLPFIYELANRGDENISGITLSTDWPDKFLTDADSQNISLPAGSVKIIKGNIKMPGQGGQYDISITPVVIINGHSLPQMPNRQTIQTIAPQIISSAQIQGGSTYLEPGQSVPVQIKWQNKSSFSLQKLQIRLKANLPGVVDWKKTAAENHALAGKDSLLIDNSSRTALSNNEKNAEDTFTVNVRLLPAFSLGQIEKAYLEIIPKAEAEINGMAGQQFIQEGARARLPLVTETNLFAEARYYTEAGDQLGRGPLPPKTGKTTKYWIFIKLSNTSNGLDDASFSATIPDGIEPTGKQSVSIGPEMVYSASNRTLTWSYNSLPANSQTALYLEVSVTPQASQIGQNIQLLKNLKFSATDDFVGKIFNLSDAAVSNILNKNDRGSASGSTVAP